MLTTALVAIAEPPSPVAPAADPPKAKWPIGKETTYVTGPLDKNGYVVYSAALNERLSKGITPANNANVLIWKAIGPRPGGESVPPEYFKALGVDAPAENGEYFVSQRTFIRDRLKRDPASDDVFFDQVDRAAKRQWTAKSYPDVAAWLDANEKPLAVIIEATKRPAYFNPLVAPGTEKEPGILIGALLPSAQRCREVTVALAARAMLRTGDRKFDEAWQDLLACHRLARLVGSGATNIEALVGFALNSVACTADIGHISATRLTGQQILSRLKDLQNLPPMPPVADKMDLGERFIALDAIQNIHHGMFAEMVAKAGKGVDPQAVQAMNLIDFAPTLRNLNQVYDRTAAAMRLPDRADRTKELKKIEDELTEIAEKRKFDQTKLGQFNRMIEILRKPEDTGKMVGNTIGDVAMGMLIPAVLKVQNAYDRCAQLQRNTEIAMALAAYRRNEASFPAKLDDLVPTYLAVVPGDLFSGKPLVYKPTEAGYLLYSVGINGQDDDGRTADDDPPGDDLAVRMPLPPLKPRK
jgi:hypothetical protein